MTVTPHRLLRMTGRDPHESGRVATPLELLFDLTFVVAFGAAGNELAHAIAEDHVGSGVASFSFAMFGICWAWINYSWFASAFDTDDWLFRVLTMIQMAGVLIFALGLPELFASVYEGDRLDNGVLVAGYVVMRVAMVGHWLRVARSDPEHRAAAETYLVTILVAQVIWCALVFVDASVPQMFALMAIPLVIELMGPYVAETHKGGTPWHAHHIAERYGLLTIITLGEGILGTVAAMSALVHDDEGGTIWTTDAVVVLGAGISITFLMWWVYFSIPWADALHARRTSSFAFGYGHIFVFASIAAVGAGLHVAQYYLEHHYPVSATTTVLSTAVPIAAFALTTLVIYSLMMRTFDAFHLLLICGTLAVVVLAVVLVASGGAVPLCLVLLTLAPLVIVVGYETVGHRHVTDHLERLRS